MRIGLDIGFGEVKAVYPDGGELRGLTFPTAVKHAAAGPAEFLEGMAQVEEFLYRGRKYVVGKEAVDDAFASRTEGFLKTYGPLLAWVAAREAQRRTGERVTRVGLGLPLAWMTAQLRAEMAAAFRGAEVNGVPLLAAPLVFAQGYGAYADVSMDNDGHRTADAPDDALVVDVGFNTVDVLNVEGGRIARAGSDTLDKCGVSRMCEELQAAVKAKKNIRLTPVEAAAVLRTGRYRVYGCEEDCSAEAGEIVDRYASWLCNELESRWEERIKRAAKLILVGGGAHYLRDRMPGRYRGMLVIPGEPEYANARGFCKLARREV